MEKITIFVQNLLLKMGVSSQIVENTTVITLLLIIVIACFVADFIARRIIVTVITIIVKRSKNKWDDIFLKRKVFNRLAHFAPALVIHYSIYLVGNHPKIIYFTQTGVYIYMIIVTVMVANSFLKALNEIYSHSPISKNRPINGYIQLVTIFVYFIAIILIIAIITGNSPGKLFAGLGAIAAVLLLVFKDTILGFVASIQLSGNNMLKIGDWISMPSKNADGTVLEITLNTVKIQNWDKTISTVPTYDLVSNSFINWKGMEESDGRRIKRSVNIDMTSVKFCSPETIERLKKINLIKSYIETKTEELESHNNKNKITDSVLVNGRRMTNLGIFRKYIELYLKNHPKIHKNMTFLVRQLQPTEKGIPIEIYVFSSNKEWAIYEEIQSDIFDHILAAIPEFELRVFQNPTGFDFNKF